MRGRPKRIYEVLTLIAVALYLLMPVWGYLMFLQLAPFAPLSVVFGSVMIVVLIFRVYAWLRWRWRLPSRNYALLWGLLIWITLLELFWGPRTISQAAPGMYLMTVALTIGAYFFLIGSEVFAFHVVNQTTWANWIWRGVALIFVILFMTVVVGVIKSRMENGQLLFYFLRYHPRAVYNYQLLSDTIAVISLMVMARYGAKGLLWSLGIYVITAVALFFSYSRASLLVYLIAGGVFVLLLSWFDPRQRKLLFKLAFVGLGLGLLGFFFARTWLGNEGSFNVIIERYFSSESFWVDFFGARAKLWNQSIPFLKDYWLSGRFMYEAIVFHAGDYIHNWMSFWLAYGIIPFVLSLYLLLATLVAAVRAIRTQPWAPLATVLVLYNLIMIVLARAYVWRFFWLTLAVSIALLAFSTSHPANEKTRLPSALE